MTAIDKALTLRNKLLDRLAKVAWLGPLLVRFTVGVVFIGTGWGKLHSLGDVTNFFVELGIPAPGFNAALVASTEFIGGLFLVAGLFTRLAALPLAFTMVIAILTAKRDDIHGLTSLLGFEETSYLVMFLVLFFVGPGKASVDHLLARWARQRGEAVQPDAAPDAHPAHQAA